MQYSAFHSNELYAVFRLEALTFQGIINSPPSVQSDLSSQFHSFHIPCSNHVYTDFWGTKIALVFINSTSISFINPMHLEIFSFRCDVQNSPCLVAIMSHVIPRDTPPAVKIYLFLRDFDKLKLHLYSSFHHPEDLHIRGRKMSVINL